VRKWIVTILIVGALAALAVTARLWLSKFLTFVGANSSAIQGLGALVQLVLWSGAGCALFIRLWKAKPNAAPPTPPEPPERPKRTTPPRPRAIVSALHQLPPPPSDFTGRVAELTELTKRIGQGGATISGLQGQGGVGKTTLALKFAEQLTPRYPDAQFYLDLKGASQQPLSTSDALAHVIRAYHPTAKLPDNEAELHALYLSVLHDQRALLLMDNAHDAEQVAPLIPPAGCVLLVTSRQHFTLPGLYAQDLDTLPPADAHALLLKIAPRIGEHADTIAKLCGRLPLALRLAASAIFERKLNPADYMRRLTDAKQQLKLIEASLTLSYDLLSAELQQRWRTLAVFPATFDAEAAAALWDVDADTAQDALGELVKYSMLDVNETDARYSLHDLARVFANHRLSDEERRAAQARHAAHYCDVLAKADNFYLQGGAAITRGLALFDTEQTNIQAGQSWAAHHADDDDATTRLCARYPEVGAYMLGLRLPPRAQINWLEQALSAARKYNDQYSEICALNNLGLAYSYLGEFRRAIEFHEQVLKIVRELGDRGNEGRVLGNLGIAYKNLGELRRATEFYEQQLVIVREIGDRRSEGDALGNLGVAYKNLGEPQRALEFYKQALTIDLELGYRRGEGTDLWSMSLALDMLGDREQAIAKAEAALRIYEQIEHPSVVKVREQLAKWHGEAE
jgi:tetratricopeptide (TPR) repeat protein